MVAEASVGDGGVSDRGGDGRGGSDGGGDGCGGSDGGGDGCGGSNGVGDVDDGSDGGSGGGRSGGSGSNRCPTAAATCGGLGCTCERLQHGLERDMKRDCSKWSARRMAAVWLAGRCQRGRSVARCQTSLLAGSGHAAGGGGGGRRQHLLGGKNRAHRLCLCLRCTARRLRLRCRCTARRLHLCLCCAAPSPRVR